MAFMGSMENATNIDTVGAMEGGLIRNCVHTATLAVCTVLVIFVLFLGCTGNGMVLCFALTSKRLRNNFDLLIINLSGADFIMCTCLAPIFLFLLFSETPIPRVFCGSILFLGTTSALLSLLSLVCIAVHRHWRVTGRARRPLSLGRTSAIVGAIWVISLSSALGGTFYVTSSWDENNPQFNCQTVINSHTPLTHNFILFFIAPITVLSLAIIGTSYTVIARMVRMQGVNIPDGPPLRNQADLGEANCDGFSGEICHPSSGLRSNVRQAAGQTVLDKGSKAMTMCLVVTLTIGLCWGPLIMSQFIELATGESIILYQVKLCGIALVFLNSALDPYIYGQTNGRIKYRYARLLYNLGRCECAVERTRTLRVVNHKTTEGRPLKSSQNSQETNTMPLPSTKAQKKLYERFVGSCFRNSANNYAQNILLLHQNDNGKFDTCIGPVGARVPVNGAPVVGPDPSGSVPL